MLHLIKIILVLFSIYLSYNQFKKLHNNTIGYYWIVVGLYWFVNLLQGLM